VMASGPPECGRKLGPGTAGNRPGGREPGRSQRLGSPGRLYQRRASGRLGVSCRYAPSCSRYGLAAIERYGLLVGARLAADRIHRCVPAVPHGTSDPLPGH
jgi:putative membrane protein insertion efficiency factor